MSWSVKFVEPVRRPMAPFFFFFEGASMSTMCAPGESPVGCVRRSARSATVMHSKSAAFLEELIAPSDKRYEVTTSALNASR